MKAQGTGSGAFEKVDGLECLYRYTANGTYYARIKTRGKEFRRSLQTTDRAVAKRKLADLQREISRIDPGAGRISVAALADKYLEGQQHLASVTRDAKALITRRLKESWPGGADQSVDKIRASDVQSWLSAQRARMGVSSWNGYVEFVRGMFALAVADRFISESPAAGIRYLRRRKPIRKTPSQEEFRAIVANIRAQVHNADAKDSADFVEFIGLAGLGQAEAGSLTWGDVDWANEQITTFRHKTRRGFVIPIYPQLRPLLERLQAECGVTPPPHEVNVLKIKDAKKAIAGACKRLELPAYSHRSFRRLFITLAIERGVDVKVVAEWQGHRDGGKLILDTYSHVAPKHSARMAKLMVESKPE